VSDRKIAGDVKRQPYVRLSRSTGRAQRLALTPGRFIHEQVPQAIYCASLSPGAYTRSHYRSTSAYLARFSPTQAYFVPHISQIDPWMCLEGAKVELQRERCVPKVLKFSRKVNECKPLPVTRVSHLLHARESVRSKQHRGIYRLHRPIVGRVHVSRSREQRRSHLRHPRLPAWSRV
jgi:hypothetical protein